MALLSKNTTIGGKNPLLYKTISNISVDLNTFHDEGTYIFNNLTNATNFPSQFTWTGKDNSAHLQVISFNKSKQFETIQIIYKNNNNTIYMRYSSSANVWTGWQRVWTTANDGTNSGLDADLLDGLQGSQYIRNYGKNYTDFNAITGTGFCQVYNAKNSPDGTTTLWGCITFQTDGSTSANNYFCQIAIKDNSAGKQLYTRKKNGSSWTAWEKIWTSGTDGSGSGLDADTIDGVQSTGLMTPMGGDIILVGWKNANHNELPFMYDSSNPTIANNTRVLYAKNYKTDMHAIKDAYTKVGNGGTIKLVGYFRLGKHEDFRKAAKSQDYVICSIQKSLTLNAYEATFELDPNMTVTSDYSGTVWVYLFKLDRYNSEFEFTIKGLTAILKNPNEDTNKTYYNIIGFKSGFGSGYGNKPNIINILDCDIVVSNATFLTWAADVYEGSSVTVKGCNINAEGQTALTADANSVHVIGNTLKGRCGLALGELTKKGIVIGNDIYYDNYGISASLYGTLNVNITGNNIRCTGKNLSTYDPTQDRNYNYYTVGIEFGITHGFGYDTYYDYVQNVVISDNRIETYDLGIDFDMRHRIKDCIITNNVITHCRPTDKALPEYGDIDNTEKLREELSYGFWCTKAIDCVIKNNICLIKSDKTNFPNGYPTYLQLNENSDVDVDGYKKDIIINVASATEIPTSVQDNSFINILDKNCYNTGIYTIKWIAKESAIDTSVVNTDLTTKTIKIIVEETYDYGSYKASNEQIINPDSTTNELIGHGELIQNKAVVQYILWSENNIYSRWAIYQPSYTLMETTSSYKKVVTGITWSVINSGFNEFLNETNIISKLKTKDGAGSGLDADLLDGLQGYGYTKAGTSESLVTTSSPITSSGVYSSMYRFKDTKNIIGEGTNIYYGIMQIYISTTSYTRLAISMTSGKVYRQTNGATSWDEISVNANPTVPVVTTDPTTIENGQLWIRSDL